MSSKAEREERIVGQEFEPQTEEHAVSTVQQPSLEKIRQRAFEIHMERGGTHGCDVDDWFQAKKELTEKLQKGREGG